jgi:Fe2+ transport system protein FeoA
MCAVHEWTESENGIEKPDRPTLSMVPVGGKAHIEKLFLPLPLKKRLLSLGLTYGTEVGVICNERGRMIITVRDSRLGLSPEVASKITYKSA